MCESLSNVKFATHQVFEADHCLVSTDIPDCLALSLQRAVAVADVADAVAGLACC